MYIYISSKPKKRERVKKSKRGNAFAVLTAALDVFGFANVPTRIAYVLQLCIEVDKKVAPLLKEPVYKISLVDFGGYGGAAEYFMFQKDFSLMTAGSVFYPLVAAVSNTLKTMNSSSSASLPNNPGSVATYWKMACQREPYPLMRTLQTLYSDILLGNTSNVKAKLRKLLQWNVLIGRSVENAIPLKSEQLPDYSLLVHIAAARGLELCKGNVTPRYASSELSYLAEQCCSS